MTAMVQLPCVSQNNVCVPYRFCFVFVFVFVSFVFFFFQFKTRFSVYQKLCMMNLVILYMCNPECMFWYSVRVRTIVKLVDHYFCSIKDDDYNLRILVYFFASLVSTGETLRGFRKGKGLENPFTIDRWTLWLCTFIPEHYSSFNLVQSPLDFEPLHSPVVSNSGVCLQLAIVVRLCVPRLWDHCER